MDLEQISISPMRRQHPLGRRGFLIDPFQPKTMIDVHGRARAELSLLLRHSLVAVGKKSIAQKRTLLDDDLLNKKKVADDIIF